MSAAGRCFITPHAVDRFRRRIALLDYDHALGAIIRGLERAVVAERVVGTRDGRSVRDIAVVGEYQFIATISGAQRTGLLPAVGSIRYGTKGGGRKPEWQRATWQKVLRGDDDQANQATE